MKQKILLTLASLCILSSAYAQEWMRIHRTYSGVDWAFPLEIAKYKDYVVTDNQKTLRANAYWNENDFPVPFTVADIDSIDFASDLADEEKGHNKYRPFTMHITTEGGGGVYDKEEWINCHFSIDGKGEYSDYSGTGRIRGRGNSSWAWYDKKPYKFKLDSKSKLLGLEKAKNWNLLANYRDVTDMMNVFAFEAARFMGMPNTNHTRFVEVFLDEEYIGLYQLTEKIEVAKNRVEIDEVDGIMVSFDQDDGPSLSPDATDNFTSSVYSLPMCVKYPDDPDAATVQAIKDDFAVVEKAIKSHDYALVATLVDIPSFIGILQLHEYLYNVEIDAPRSIYAYKDKDGKYVFGPVWDWDAGYDFDWSDMTTGHTFFSDYRELIYGTDPVKGTGAAYNINKFWRDMFANSTFVAEYKKAWSEKSADLFLAPWAETSKYIAALTEENAYGRDIDRWPLTSSSGDWWNHTVTTFLPSEEIAKMSSWLKKRKQYLDGVIAAYPAGNDDVEDITDPSDVKVVKTISKTQRCSYYSGYTQSGSVMISQSEVETVLGGAPAELVPLNADGAEGRNTAAKQYGAWFDVSGNTVDWSGDARVYIESDNLYTWSYGCHPDNTSIGNEYTVTMQYRRGAKAVNVVVRLIINN